MPAEPVPQHAWGLERLHLQACWQRGFTGAGVRVGHLDTGVDGNHPELMDRIDGFMEFDKNGCPVSGSMPGDSGSHGTHIAGIICGKSVGVAPGARLCSGLVIEGGNSPARVLAGLEWLLDCKVRVLCISLGFPDDNPMYETILSRMKRTGILIVAPVGNRGSGHCCSPANYPGVLAVGAMNENDRMARFSGSRLFTRALDHAKPNLLAPGVNILSAAPGGGYQVLSGTSMAAAHVAGVAAILFQARPDASAEAVEEAILSTCTSLPGLSRQRGGRGLINPLKALDLLLSNNGAKQIGRGRARKNADTPS